MRWLIKSNKYNPDDRRAVTCFAFLPVSVGKHIVWLELYTSYQRYEKSLLNDEYWWYETSRELYGASK